jgi:pimeloyl-ACP methyl ester carboxylesterase
MLRMRAVAAIAVLLSATAAQAGHVKSRDHTTERNGLKLALYEKWKTGEESKWKANGKVALLVHGATWSSYCTFDTVPGYSMMDALAEDGWDVWAVDLHNYGASGKTDADWTEAASAMNDVDTAADYIRALRWTDKVAVFGYQWGAQVAALFAEAHANKVARLALFGMRYKLYDQTPVPKDPMRKNSFSSALLKPEDGDLDPAIVKKRAEACSLHDVSSPNGALKDLGKASGSNPKRLQAPVLLLQGEHDGDAEALSDRLDYFKALATKSKWFVVLAGLGRYAPLERGHQRFEKALLDFLDAP